MLVITRYRTQQLQEPRACLNELTLLKQKERNSSQHSGVPPGTQGQGCSPASRRAGTSLGGCLLKSEGVSFISCFHFLLFSFSENWLSLPLWFKWEKHTTLHLPNGIQSRTTPSFFDSIHDTEKLALSISDLMQNSWERECECCSLGSSEYSWPDQPWLRASSWAHTYRLKVGVREVALLSWEIGVCYTLSRHQPKGIYTNGERWSAALS